MTNVERPLSQLWRIQGAEYRMSHAGTLRPAELRLALTANETHWPTRSATTWRSQHYADPSNSLGIRAIGLVMFLALVLLVITTPRLGEKLDAADTGFGRVSWQTPLLAVALTAAMIWLWGPVSAWVLAKLRLGSFATGTSALAGLPVWYLVVTIILVAASEEWLSQQRKFRPLEQPVESKPIVLRSGRPRARFLVK